MVASYFHATTMRRPPSDARGKFRASLTGGGKPSGRHVSTPTACAALAHSEPGQPERIESSSLAEAMRQTRQEAHREVVSSERGNGLSSCPQLPNNASFPPVAHD